MGEKSERSGVMWGGLRVKKISVLLFGNKFRPRLAGGGQKGRRGK